MKKDSFCETKNRDFLVESSEAYTIYITADTLQRVLVINILNFELMKKI